MVNKQPIRSTVVNRALWKLTSISQINISVTIVNNWEYSSERSGPELWKPLINKNGRESNNSDQTDSDDIEGNDKFKERELKKFPHFFLL